MPAIAKSEADTDREWDILWAIRDAQTNAYMEGDGEPQAIHLIDALQKHGLVIVESAHQDRMRTALKLIGSCELDHLVVTVARNALAKAS